MSEMSVEDLYKERDSIVEMLKAKHDEIASLERAHERFMTKYRNELNNIHKRLNMIRTSLYEAGESIDDI